MEEHIRKYFSEVSKGKAGGRCTEVTLLHNSPDVSWDDISTRVPSLPRGWYELSQLSAEDRVEFTRDFWLSKLPFHPRISEFVTQFFTLIADIGVVVARKQPGKPYRAHMIYALKGDKIFFHGAPGMTEEEAKELANLFPEVILPVDYTAFLEIHNGFSKTSDTGILGTRVLPKALKRFRDALDPERPPLAPSGESVAPAALIPFYESFGMPFYQCFWQDWYPEQEMGNVYFSGNSQTISDTSGRSEESMAFPTFLDWLIFYLETVQVK